MNLFDDETPFTNQVFKDPSIERKPDLEVPLGFVPEVNTDPPVSPTIPLSGVQPYESEGVSALLVPPGGLPTRGRAMVPVRVPPGYSLLDFRNCVVSAYMQFVQEGVVKHEALALHTGMSNTQAAAIMGTPEFVYACQVRGIELGGHKPGLTTEQDLFLQVLLDPSDGLTLQKKMKKAGVSMTKYRAWMKNPVFKQYVDNVSEQLLAENHVALVQLERLVGEGDLRAIQFKLEMNNRYNPRREATIDMLMVMNHIMEILAKHVNDPQVLMAVAGEMKELAEAASNGQAPKQLEG